MSRPQATQEQYLAALYGTEIAAAERNDRILHRSTAVALSAVVCILAAFAPPLILLGVFVPSLSRRVKSGPPMPKSERGALAELSDASRSFGRAGSSW